MRDEGRPYKYSTSKLYKDAGRGQTIQCEDPIGMRDEGRPFPMLMIRSLKASDVLKIAIFFSFNTVTDRDVILWLFILVEREASFDEKPNLSDAHIVKNECPLFFSNSQKTSDPLTGNYQNYNDINKKIFYSTGIGTGVLHA